MQIKPVLAVLFSVVVCFSPSFGQKMITDIKPTVILISLDGFRYDYLDKHKPPTLTKMAANGVRAKWMEPSFPTKTFPNHYTVVTGLYPQNHGIVENNVYDFGELFTMSKRREVQDPRWWGGEPIWATAEKQGQKAANYFWPGSEAPIGGKYASSYRMYNGYVPNTFRVDKVLGYLDQPQATRPTILTMYIADTDEVGHEFGPESAELGYAVHEVDAVIERLMRGLQVRGIEDKVNVIITSDHGMATYDASKIIYLEDAFNKDDTEQVVTASPLVQIFPKQEKIETVFNAVKAVKDVTCWKKNEIPSKFNYNKGNRIAPILCMADVGYLIGTHKWYNDWSINQDGVARPRGAHGWDNDLPEMRATFIAFGPAFKKGYVAEPFENVEIYNLMCKILGIKPAPNDGKLDRVKDMLR
ncbi:MAG TPA: ectonucleotide pyrophosphatase/phosphodiesterase [Pyrinomonadaceae bacterium]|nr:ectonucleotide pyrophosphatase/phosphodiesterase [Pyrinomonadaceae bacterium]